MTTFCDGRTRRRVGRWTIRAQVFGLALASFSRGGAALAQESSTPAATSGPEEREELEALKQTGDTAYRERRFTDALEAYDRAFEISADPRITFNRSRTLTALARYPEALAALEEFERTAPPELKQRVTNLESLQADLRGRVATLSVRGAVEGARVLVGGKVLGSAPLSAIPVNAGSVVLEVLADGYLPYARRLELPAGKLTELDVELVAKERAAVLTVRSAVPGASVSVDGKQRGTSPLELPLLPGSHLVLVAKEGFDSAQRVEVLRAGERKALALDPTPRVPLTARWWFWAGIGVAVAGVAVTALALTSERAPDQGDIGPGQVQAPLFGF